jgi:hypothetical protein
MTSIVVDDEQAKAIAESPGMVEVRDRTGAILGYMTHGFTAEDISIAKQRLQSDEPRFTKRQVLDRLRAAETR